MNSETRYNIYQERLNQIIERINQIKQEFRNGNRTNEYELLVLNSQKRWIEELLQNVDVIEANAYFNGTDITSTERVIYELVKEKDGYPLLTKLIRLSHKKSTKNVYKIDLPKENITALNIALRKEFGKTNGTLTLDELGIEKLNKLLNEVRDDFNTQTILGIMPLNFDRIYSLLTTETYEYYKMLKLIEQFSMFIEPSRISEYRRLVRGLKRNDGKFLKGHIVKDIEEQLDFLGTDIKEDLMILVNNTFNNFKHSFGGHYYKGKTDAFNVLKNRKLIDFDLKRSESALSTLEYNIANKEKTAVRDEEIDKEIQREITTLLGLEVPGLDFTNIKETDVVKIYKKVFMHDLVTNAFDKQSGITLKK